MERVGWGGGGIVFWYLGRYHYPVEPQQLLGGETKDMLLSRSWVAP